MSAACASCGTAAPQVGPYAAVPDFCAACGAATPIDLPPAVAAGFRIEPHADLTSTWVAGPPRALDVWCQPKKLHHYVATHDNVRDDFDARISLRVLEGNAAKLAVGLTFRESRLGSYGFRIDGNGAFVVSYSVLKNYGGELIPWTSTDACRKGFGVTNQLRVVARGVSLCGWINGVQVFSLHDSRYGAGKLHASLDPEDQRAHVVFTEFDLREPPP